MERTKPMNLLSWWQSLQNKLRSNRTYIFPTKFGFYYALSLMLMFAVAYIYLNNLVYFIFFFLASYGFISMWTTNFNIYRIKVSAFPYSDFFADEKGRVKVTVFNNGSSPAYLVRVRLQNESSEEMIQEIPPQQSYEVELFYNSKGRGFRTMPTVILESTYPVGLLRSWQILRVRTQILVYPARLGTNLFPGSSRASGTADEGHKKRISVDDGFQGHKPYQNSDSIRQIDWKAYARSQELLVKQFETEEKGAYVFRWQDTHGIKSTEDRLSQMALWCNLADKKKVQFQVVMPGWTSKMGQGSQHSAEILRNLALYEESR